MLQGGAHLQFEGYLVEFGVLCVMIQRLGYLADIVQGVVAEAVKLVRLALIYGVGPVYLEILLCQGRYAVHVLIVIGYDACSENVGDVTQGLVFVSLALQFAYEGLLCLYARLYLVDLYANLCDEIVELLHYHTSQHDVARHLLMVFLQQRCVVDVQCHLNSKRFINPVIVKTEVMVGFIP